MVATANRQLTSQDTAGPLPTDALAWQNQANAEVKGLWRYVTQQIFITGGTANALIASSDGTVVSGITGYASGQKFSFTPTTSNTGAVTVNIDGAGVKSINDAAGVALGAGKIAAFVTVLMEYDGTGFRVLSPATLAASVTTGAPNLVIQDQKSQNTSGGTFTSGSFLQRNLNTVIRNALSGASLSANQITLPAGSFYVTWSATALACVNHQTRLANITTPANTFPGRSGLALNSAPIQQSVSDGSATFTLSSPAVFELQHRCSATRATDGFGLATNFTTEVYSEVQVWKV